VFKILVLAGLLAAAAVPGCAEHYHKLVLNLGGGVSNPVQSTASYAGTSGNIDGGVGYSFDNHNSLIAEFMWAGLPPQFAALNPPNGPLARVNLYSVTPNYRYKVDRLRGSHFGVYAIGGGGWYYRYSSLNDNYIVPTGTSCLPIDTWLGFTCTTSGVYNTTGATYKYMSAGGLNAGAGLTIALGESSWRFYVESRYHHAFSRIPTSLVLVTLGLRFN
jgi:hypothetical protein